MMILVFHSYPSWLTILHRHLGCLKICRASFPLGPCPEAPQGVRRRAGSWWDTVCSSADEVWPAASLSSDTSAATAWIFGSSTGKFTTYLEKPPTSYTVYITYFLVHGASILGFCWCWTCERTMFCLNRRPDIPLCLPPTSAYSSIFHETTLQIQQFEASQAMMFHLTWVQIHPKSLKKCQMSIHSSHHFPRFPSIFPSPGSPGSSTWGPPGAVGPGPPSHRAVPGLPPTSPSPGALRHENLEPGTMGIPDFMVI